MNVNGVIACHDKETEAVMKYVIILIKAMVEMARKSRKSQIDCFIIQP